MVLGGGREQAERRGADGETIAGYRRAERQPARQRGPLRFGELVEQPLDRPEEVEQAGERQFRLRLDRVRAKHREPLGGLTHDVLEQGGLPHPRLTVDDQRTADPLPRGATEQPLDPLDLVVPPEQHGRNSFRPASELRHRPPPRTWRAGSVRERIPSLR